MGKRWMIVVAVGAAGCASATPEPAVPDGRVEITEPVPLVAPDEKESPPPATRLTTTRTIGEGSDGYSPRAPVGAAAPRSTTVVVNAAPMAYPRVGYRSMRVVPAPGTPGTSYGTTPGTPAVGGNWRPPRSYGPPTLR